MENLLGSVLLRRMSWFGRLRYLLLDRHFGRTLYVGMVSLCLLGTLVSAFLLREIWGPSDIIKGFLPAVAVVGLGIVVFVYTRMSWMPVILILISTLVADGVGTGTGTKLTFTFLMLNLWLLVWLFKMLVVERKLYVIPSIANWPILAFCVIVLISFVWSWVFVEDSVRYYFSDKFFPRVMATVVLIISPLTILMVSNAIQDERPLRIIVWWFVGTGFVYGFLLATTQSLPRPLNPGGQFPAWATIFCLGQLLFNRRINWIVRLVLGAAVAFWVFIGFSVALSWLSGWLPTTMGIVIVSLLYSRKMLIPIAFVIVVFIISNFTTLQENFSSETQVSGETRSEAWSHAFDLTSDHWLFGTGPTGYQFYFLERGVFSGAVGTGQLAHNNYVDIIAQLGISGIAGWLTVWLAVGYMTFKMYRTVPADESGFMSGLKATLLAAWPITMVSMMLGDWVTPFAYTQGLAGIDYTIWHWVLAGLSIGVYNILIKRAGLPQREALPSGEIHAQTQSR